MSSSCANASLNSNSVGRRINSDVVQQLEVGESNLSDCLLVLGAPTLVGQSDDGTQFVLSYEWLRTAGWKVGVSVPLSDFINTSVNYANSDSSPNFVKLIFNNDWRLIKVLQG